VVSAGDKQTEESIFAYKEQYPGAGQQNIAVSFSFLLGKLISQHSEDILSEKSLSLLPYHLKCQYWTKSGAVTQF
jgi:hypothetical protein